MARKRNADLASSSLALASSSLALASSSLAPLATITSSDLEAVTGGRVSIQKGPSPEVIQGLKSVTEGVAALGQKKQAEQAGQQQQMGQMMQQMMGRRG